MRTGAVASLMRLLRPYGWFFPVLVVLGIAASAAEGLGIGLIIPALDVLLDTSAQSSTGPLAEFTRSLGERFADRNLLAVLGALIIVLVGFKTAVLILEAAVSTALIGRITRDLRVAGSRQLLEVGMQFHMSADQGQLLNTLDTQTDRTSQALTALSVLISSLTTIAVFVILLFLLSWQMTLVAIATALPVTLIVRRLSTKARSYGHRLVQRHSDLMTRMVEMLNGMRTIRLFNQEESEARRFASCADAFRRTYIRSETLVRVLPSVVELLYVPLFIAVLVYARRAEIDMASVMVFLLLLYRLQNPMKKADTSRVVLSNYGGGIAEVERLLDRSDKPYVQSGRRIVQRISREIRFDNVTFRYRSGSVPALDGVSLTIPRGSTFAIAGGSGAGKSTLINLICRFYDPDEGAVLLDKLDLRRADLRSWRNCLAFAGQDAELMSGSVAWNISFGRPGATRTEIRQAAKLAHADRFIESLPEGYDTKIGLRGSRLSGGQRQRIALARALLVKPEVLILDEATNAVDNLTEQGIQHAIQELAGTMTIIVIAHRLSALRGADHVVVLEEGRLVEEGRTNSGPGINSALERVFRDDGNGSTMDGPSA